MSQSSTDSGAPPAQPGDGAVWATVVICTRNRAECLRLTLDQIAVQVCPRPWSIMVVDNGSTDATAESAREFAAGCPVRLDVLHERKPGLSAARNLALRRAHSEVLIFADDDIDPQPGWLSAYAEAFADPGVVAAGGPIIPRLEGVRDPLLLKVLSKERGGVASRYYFGDTRAEIDRQTIPLPFGANMAIRTGTARNTGFFREDLGWGRAQVPGEETEFLLRLFRSGTNRFLYLPQATVYHRVATERLNWDYYGKWHLGYGRSRILKRPKPGSGERWWKATQLAIRIPLYFLAAKLCPSSQRARKIRKYNQTLGSFLQLIGR